MGAISSVVRRITIVRTHIMGLLTPLVTIHESSSRVHEGFSVQVLRSALDFTCRARRRDDSGFSVEVQTWVKGKYRIQAN